jgi:hypothetical protein
METNRSKKRANSKTVTKKSQPIAAKRRLNNIIENKSQTAKEKIEYIFEELVIINLFNYKFIF